MHLRRSSQLLFTLSLLVGCGAMDDTAKPRVLDESVGARIDLDVAQRWMNRAREGSADAAGSYHRVSASQLAAVSNAAPDRLGLAFHHALDDEGGHRLLLTAVNEDGDLWRSAVLDTSTDATMDLDVARAWAERHAWTNPDAAQYHFYGRDMFDEIMSDPGFAHLEVMSAINDDGQPQLVLMAWDRGDGTAGPRSAGPASYDTGMTCPPMCGP